MSDLQIILKAQCQYNNAQEYYYINNLINQNNSAL